MVETTGSGRVANPSAGHLSVQVEGQHPADVPFLFEQQPKRNWLALAASFAYHVSMIVLTLVAIRYGTHASASTNPFIPDSTNRQIVWLNEPGPGSFSQTIWLLVGSGRNGLVDALACVP